VQLFSRLGRCHLPNLPVGCNLLNLTLSKPTEGLQNQCLVDVTVGTGNGV